MKVYVYVYVSKYDINNSFLLMQFIHLLITPSSRFYPLFNACAHHAYEENLASLLTQNYAVTDLLLE